MGPDRHVAKAIDLLERVDGAGAREKCVYVELAIAHAVTAITILDGDR